MTPPIWLEARGRPRASTADENDLPRDLSPCHAPPWQAHRPVQKSWNSQRGGTIGGVLRAPLTSTFDESCRATGL
jgi:hypothetical protein